MESIASPALWAVFGALVLGALTLDLGLLNRKAHAPSFREALGWSAVWVALALGFNAVLWGVEGRQPALEFLTGYIIEYALSVDNVFIFLVIFASFRVPRALQHRVLFWGVLGAVLMRAAMIVGGTALLERFHWLIYLFGGFLVLTGIRMLVKTESEDHPENSRVLNLLRRVLPTTTDFHGDRFFIREAGRRLATPLFLVLILVEFTDVVFALDSIPAIFSVTTDPFLVFSSNIFAILGLRSLFFVLDGVMHRFSALKVGLALTLVFVGAKMALSTWVHVPIGLSLAIIATLIGGSIGWSLLKTRNQPAS